MLLFQKIKLEHSHLVVLVVPNPVRGGIKVGSFAEFVTCGLWPIQKEFMGSEIFEYLLDVHDTTGLRKSWKLSSIRVCCERKPGIIDQ
jgi:hypothetical protein